MLFLAILLENFDEESLNEKDEEEEDKLISALPLRK
jgi:hypothetical protein